MKLTTVIVAVIFGLAAPPAAGYSNNDYYDCNPDDPYCCEQCKDLCIVPDCSSYWSCGTCNPNTYKCHCT
ncbi:unnamed protein product [Zymoseptoria tritici ST99CH_3D7]|uniref:Uncharacterized protein n=1 Tax=Zymoseptoria tritici (strain ST99CH_3D7) TaxID=1276538 RepID=A0A1X7S3E3_ZYMT9|nr:unnamed protein product [Zymoseptoria tritici ST99CH_3D7]